MAQQSTELNNPFHVGMGSYQIEYRLVPYSHLQIYLPNSYLFVRFGVKVKSKI